MKRWINFAQWLALVALAAGVVWMVVKPPPPVDYAPETWSNWDGFMAISYAGVSRNDSSLYPSSKTLAGHFEALQAAGYHTVTPDDTLAFLERREPLPSKAVLILLEGARKETFIRAHPVLSRLGMRATLCVPTESLMNWDESKLKERDVGKIAGMPQWSLASMGNEAPNPIVVSAQKKTDHFLSKRQWLRKLDREENDGEFRQRVAGDYQESSAILKKINGAPVVAYVYPYSDNGFRADADPLAGAINNSCLASNYSLAFVSASNLIIGAQSSSTGNVVTVTGSGSSLYVTNATAAGGQLVVGQNGGGTLTLANGGLLYVNQLLVTNNVVGGPTNSFFTGISGGATLITSNAANALAANIINQTNTIANWTINGKWVMLGGTNLFSNTGTAGGNGARMILDGGMMIVSNGAQFIGTLTGNNITLQNASTVLVANAGSTLVNNKALALGGAGTANYLSITDSGKVVASVTLNGVGNQVLVSGAGSVMTSRSPPTTH